VFLLLLSFDSHNIFVDLCDKKMHNKNGQTCGGLLQKAPKVLRTFLMLLLLAPFFEVRESMFVSVQVEHTCNDACENAGHMFRSHIK
jgi:hypothetical protein